MALFDRKHRLPLPGGYWMEKADDDTWQIGKGRSFQAFQLTTNVPVGRDGSFDSEARAFAEAMNSAPPVVALDGSGERG